MRHLLFLLLLLPAGLRADNACDSGNVSQPVPIAVAGNSLVTLATSVSKQDIHICKLEFVLPEGNTVLIQASDGTAIEGPEKLANAGAYFVDWHGQKSTANAALGSNIQIQLTNAPSVTVYVSITYYQVPRQHP